MGLFSKKRAYDFDMVTTKGGDTGDTSLYDGSRIAKSDITVETLAHGDMAMSYLGVVRKNPILFRDTLRDTQSMLYIIMSQIATPPGPAYDQLTHVTEDDIAGLEKRMKELLDQTKIEPKFVIPGDDSRLSAEIDVARTHVRLFEVYLVRYIRERSRTVDRTQSLALCQKYVNRLSDYLFVLARHVESTNYVV